MNRFLEISLTGAAVVAVLVAPVAAGTASGSPVTAETHIAHVETVQRAGAFDAAADGMGVVATADHHSAIVHNAPGS